MLGTTTIAEPPANATETVDWRSALRTACEGTGVTSLFQPIVRLSDARVVGYEALARFEHPAITVGPEVWFRRAGAAGLGAQLEAQALQSSLTALAQLDDEARLHVNLVPQHLADQRVQAALHSAGPLDRLVVELTDHAPWDWQELEFLVSHLRANGAEIALDAVGPSFSDLRRTMQLRPSVLKLHPDVVQHIDADPAKQALAEMVVVFARRLGARVVAVGVERHEEFEALHALGVTHAQGWYFAGPALPWAPIDDLARRRIVHGA